MLAAELVVHLIAPTGDTGRAEYGYGHLRRIWYACRDVLGVAAAAPGLGVPTDLPDSPADLKGAGAPIVEQIVASQQADGPGVFQTVLRRQRGLFCLSAILAPRPGEEVGWSELDARWDEAGTASRSDFVDQTRIYQGLLPRFNVLSGYPQAASAELVGEYASELPSFDRADGWEHRGATTLEGFALWEPGAGGDDRALRRLLVIADAQREAALGAWTWSSGGTAPPSLQLYLAEAAKMRLQARVWAAGTAAVERLRRGLDDGARQLGGGLAEAGLLGTDGAEAASVLARPLAQLRADVFYETVTRTSLLDVERNVRIVEANMRSLTASTVIPTGLADPFADDQRCARHLADLLADSAAFLSSAGARARAAVDAAERAGLAASVEAPMADLPITGEDRLMFLDELAELYVDPRLACQLAERVGVPRRRLPFAVGMSPRTWWGEVLRELESGLVPSPLRGLLGAALEDYRHNPRFLDLASRYRLPSDSPGRVEDDPSPQRM
ncbi:CATRA conflict system CASPASE/TPR repeat-associated protein [Frankia sp. Cas3]|uniref:CATRA conflict system CASPASE/TPR repeat-associated protein n=1 Tax=Frankia sp. Cas3 TaxID=3073926 RepID=UPI002AD3D498|nr:CATRA conflict system CASPASE/TPR repeat-associated protein [Frankia sp. Cas3]